MKKIFRYLLVGIAIVFIFVNLGCPLEGNKAHVRFQNSTDYTLFYGVKYGDAVYNGEVPPGFISAYYETEPGTYSLQAKDASALYHKFCFNHRQYIIS
ncbi:MAG: hypothetical protein FVQ80_16180 [Planctomycetes bacterium]|nr:hypothetical protein [Planctomycetota bacterium]